MLHHPEGTTKFRATDLLFSPHVLVLLLFFLTLRGIRVPSESLFVEGDDHLRTLPVGLLRRHQVSLV